jgi:hypothetical protein
MIVDGDGLALADRAPDGDAFAWTDMTTSFILRQVYRFDFGRKPNMEQRAPIVLGKIGSSQSVASVAI